LTLKPRRWWSWHKFLQFGDGVHGCQHDLFLLSVRVFVRVLTWPMGWSDGMVEDKSTMICCIGTFIHGRYCARAFDFFSRA
jgi:hypothetical protein